MSARHAFWAVSGFLLGSEVYSIIDYAQRTSADVGLRMALSLLIGIGATLVWCIGLISEPRSVEKIDPAP